jgi:hypothetical protein
LFPRVRRALVDNARWFASGWAHWFWLAGLVLALCVILFFPCKPADRVRYSGILLEWLGILTVAWGLWDRLRMFESEESRISGGGLIDWLRRFPGWGSRATTVALSGVAAIGGVGAVATLNGSRAPMTDRPLELRLAVLETDFVVLRNEHAALVHSVGQDVKKLSATVDGERRAREALSVELQRKLKTSSVGNAHRENAGLLWLFDL